MAVTSAACVLIVRLRRARSRDASSRVASVFKSKCRMRLEGGSRLPRSLLQSRQSFESSVSLESQK